ncbi:putative Ferric reduction oxidase 4 [Cocos nucifera]|uniref:Putative Ferric reduction oxidase 4 n=1 Tax=Cocos nucifera TaxID=13894 RepID=A0A8K0N4G9_COCNU|nr:putative Ferric reduction oxidase 4 [Cocos nucifera]
MLDLLLPISCNASDLSRLQLRVEAFITREKLPASDGQKHIQTVCFKPFSSDLPIAPVLGPNGWLWLGAVVSSSFVAFLVLMGILTRYCIYPIDHNTGKVFSYAARSSLNLLLICACIAITASAAVLWNKRSSTVEAKKIQKVDAPMSSTSPSSYFYNGDRELESVPQESIVKATRLHYGERPNVKKMLSELDGSYIGVMASGPSLLRHDVAAVCSSGLAKNLHFESISFSW